MSFHPLDGPRRNNRETIAAAMRHQQKTDQIEAALSGAFEGREDILVTLSDELAEKANGAYNEMVEQAVMDRVLPPGSCETLIYDLATFAICKLLASANSRALEKMDALHQ